MTDTKAQWKRRALKAEQELQTIRNIRMMEHNSEMHLACKNAILTTAFNEMKDSMRYAIETIEAMGD